MSTNASQEGLRGIKAGSTSICTVGQQGDGLHYRGYSVEDLVEQTSFGEVAYLLLYGELPNATQLTEYKTRLKGMRALPPALCDVLERIPADAHPMDVMRTGCSMLGNLEPEADFSQQDAAADRLLAILPSIMGYWFRFTRFGERMDTATDDDTIAGHLLHVVHGKPAPEDHVKCIDTSLILYAEHEFNASTFAARVCAATLSDMHSAITGAIGTLRGPLHGGANEAAMALIERFSSADEAHAGVTDMLARKEKVMGFGHAVYKVKDPRNAINKSWSKRLSQGHDKAHSVSGVGSHREAARRRKGPVRQRRLLQREHVPLHGHRHGVVHAHLRVLTPDRLGGSREGAAGQQQADPTRSRIHRSRRASCAAAGRSLGQKIGLCTQLVHPRPEI